MTETRLLTRAERWQAMRHPFDQAAVASLFVLVPSPGRAGLVTVAATAVLAAVVVVTPSVRRSPWPWLVFAAMHAYWYLSGWYWRDNHEALILYWALALAIGGAINGRTRALELQARIMLGLTFALAAAWKLFSEQFRSGDFFAFTVVYDPRFGRIVQAVAGSTPEQVADNRSALEEAGAALRPGTVQLEGIEAVAPFALALTVATIVVELTVAVLMLLPDREGRDLLRSAALGVFLVGTYVMVPVPRFGVVLMAMGIAQAPDRPRIRLAFGVGVVVLAVWANLWLAFVLVGA